tara:strand:+ start:529 stop:747 length:219 start_codon:yes stop_codon:yes gene_type:complete
MSDIFNSIKISTEVKKEVDEVVFNVEKEHLCMAFLEHIEDNYYYNSGGWVNCETDIHKSRTLIYKEFTDKFK